MYFLRRLYLLPIFIPSLALAAPLQVLIDPGHGGSDHGAVRGAVREAHVALRVSQKLAQLLNQDARFQSHLTRNNDVTLSLEHRVEMAKTFSADVFVSIHVNSNEEKHLNGPEFYFQSVMAADDYAQFLANRENSGDEAVRLHEAAAPTERLSAHEDVAHILADLRRNFHVRLSALFAQSLQKKWYEGSPKSHAHKVRQAPFFVISQVNVPSVLVELGYVSNPSEAERLSHDGYQDQMAHHLYSALIEFKETLDKMHLSRLH